MRNASKCIEWHETLCLSRVFFFCGLSFRVCSANSANTTRSPLLQSARDRWSTKEKYIKKRKRLGFGNNWRHGIKIEYILSQYVDDGVWFYWWVVVLGAAQTDRWLIYWKYCLTVSRMPIVRIWYLTIMVIVFKIAHGRKKDIRILFLSFFF